MKSLLAALLLVPVAALAETQTWNVELWHPTYPPKKVNPLISSEQKQIQEAARDALLKRSPRTLISPEDGFLTAYKLIQTAQTALDKQDYSFASNNLLQAISTLSDLRKQFPKWGKEIVDYRMDLANSLLDSIPKK